MKRIFIFLFSLACMVVMYSCGNSNTMAGSAGPLREPEQKAATTEPIQNTVFNAAEEEKVFSQEDILSLFSSRKEPEWQYISCVLIPDHAADRIGAVLFWDSEEETSNVAFFDPDGYYQECGVHAKVIPERGFTYLGNGAVAFFAEEKDGKAAQYTITLSIEGSDVNFKVKLDPQENQ